MAVWLGGWGEQSFSPLFCICWDATLSGMSIFQELEKLLEKRIQAKRFKGETFENYGLFLWRIEQLSIEGLPPKPRGKNKIDILKFFRALHYKAVTGCPWRALPPGFGNWNSIQSRFLDWRAAGIFELIEKKFKERGVTDFPWKGLDTMTRPNGQADSDTLK
jgi:transposase